MSGLIVGIEVGGAGDSPVSARIRQVQITNMGSITHHPDDALSGYLVFEDNVGLAVATEIG